MIATLSELRKTFPVRSKNPVRAIIVLASLLLLSACDQQNESGRISVDGAETNASFTPPTQLLSTRSIVRTNLILEITIDGETSVVGPNAAGVFEFKTTRPANSSTTVTVVWSELIDGELLPLARATKRLDVGSVSSAAVLQFSSSEFDTTSDDEDEDGVSNFIERRDGEDGAFNDPNSPISPPVIVTVDVQLALPVGMRDATAERRAAVTAKALVNSETILLSRDGDVWTGSTTVNENTEPLVTATFHALADEETTIASLARSQNIGGGGQIVFSEGDYVVDFNDDGDDFNNIQETAIGSNPRDSSDPRAPVANAGADTSISSGATVTLNGSGSSSDSDGSIATFRWTEGSNDLGTGVSLVVSGLGVGLHEIELRITDNLGLTDTDTVVVTVTAATVPNQLPVASAGADQTIASGASVTLNAGDSSDPDGSIASYQWSEGGVSRGTSESLVLSNLSDGQHVISLLVTDDDGATDTDTVTITVTAAPVENELPVADAGANQTIDSGASVTLNGSGSSDAEGNIASYRWSEGSTTLGTGVSLLVSDLSDGSHEITLQVTDSDGATDTDTVTVVVTDAPPPPNELPEADAGANQTIDSGNSVTLNGGGSTDSDGTIVSYEWSEGSETLGSGVGLVISDLSDGSHVIVLEVTDSDGATDTDTVTVVVTAAPPPPNELPEAEAGANQTIDSGDSVTLDGSGSTDSDGTIVSYEWSENSTTLGTGVSLVLSDLSDGTHGITLEVTDSDGATASDTVTITVTASPEPPEADAGNNQTIDSGDSVVLNGSDSSDPDGSIVSYEWSEGLEILGSGVSLELSDLTDGEHVIKLVVTDDDELTDSDTVTVDVTAAQEPDLPPMADAGMDQIIESGELVTLDGSGSSDEDGTIVSYQWSDDVAILGADVSLVLSDLSEGEHEFTLLVTDDDDLTGSDTVSVNVTAAGDAGGEDASDNGRVIRVDDAKTSATGEFFAPIRTLA